MKINLISRYIFKDILRYFALWVLFVVVIMLVNEIFDTRQEFLEKEPPVMTVILFLALSLPKQFAWCLPLIGLLGTMMAYGLLAKNREILAMIAAGISFRHLAVPALVFGVCLSLGAFWFNEQVVPVCTNQARYIEKVDIGGRSESIFTKRKNLFVKGIGDRFYFMQEYQPETETMTYPTILEVSADGQGLEERIEARQARLAQGEGDRRYWEFTGAERWQFKPDGSLASYQKYAGPYEVAMEENLAKFLSKSKNPDEMNLAELRDYVGLLNQRGDGKIGRYSTPMQQKMAFPLVCLMMTMLGFAVVLDLHARRFARGAFTGLIIAIGYYLLEGFMMSLGQDNHLPPVVAGWTTLVVFTALVLYLIGRLEKIGN